MRNKRYILLAIFSLLITIMIFGSQGLWAVEKKVYINGIDANFPPFASIDDQGNPVGFDIDCVNWIAKEMGFEVKTIPISWDAIIPALRAKKIDFIASGMTITEERKKVVDFTIPYWPTDQAVIAREDSDLDIINALSGKYTVGVNRGCSAQTWIENNLIKKGILGEDKLKLYESALMAINDVVSGRLDVSMGDELMFEQAVKRKPLKIIGIIKSEEAYGYAVRKEDQELKEMLNEGLRRLMKSPKWDEFVANMYE